jgi:hypothetical protein
MSRSFEEMNTKDTLLKKHSMLQAHCDRWGNGCPESKNREGEALPHPSHRLPYPVTVLRT